MLFAAVALCQETLEEETSVSSSDDRKEKRGISLNLGQGFEGYSYLGPSSRGMNYRGYTPITELGYDNVNYGVGASNFAGGFSNGYQGNNQPYGSYPYRSGYQPAYSYQRQYSTPVNTFPLGGIGTVGPYGGAAYNGNLQNGPYQTGYQTGGYQNSGFQPSGYPSSSFGHGAGFSGALPYNNGYQQQQGFF